VDADVVAVELQLVAVALARVGIDAHRERGDVARKAELPVLVATGVRLELDGGASGVGGGHRVSAGWRMLRGLRIIFPRATTFGHHSTQMIDRQRILDGLGAKLREARGRTDLSVSDLAREAGVSRRYVTEAEAGRANLSV